MRIGIMGGTFNPIHNGHLLIAENAYDQFHLDKVLFIPAGIPPHKQQLEILDKELRCAMIEAAIGNVPYFKLDRREIDSMEISYTAATLTQLSIEQPDNTFYFIMGADSLAYLDKWRSPEIILSHATILAAVRDTMETEQLNAEIHRITQLIPGDIKPIYTPTFNVSSKEIRQRIKDHRSIRYLVPESVDRFITEKKLYLV